MDRCKYCGELVYDGVDCTCSGKMLEARVAELERAFDDQTRELEIALEFLTPENITEFRRRAYPKLYPER